MKTTCLLHFKTDDVRRHVPWHRPRPAGVGLRRDHHPHSWGQPDAWALHRGSGGWSGAWMPWDSHYGTCSHTCQAPARAHSSGAQPQHRSDWRCNHQFHELNPAECSLAAILLSVCAAVMQHLHSIARFWNIIQRQFATWSCIKNDLDHQYSMEQPSQGCATPVVIGSVDSNGSASSSVVHVSPSNTALHLR